MNTETKEKRPVGRPKKEEPYIFFDVKMLRALLFFEKSTVRAMSIKLGYNPSVLSVYTRDRNRHEITPQLNDRLNNYIRKMGYSVDMLQQMRKDIEPYL